MQVNFNPSLASLAKQAEELISSTKIEVQGQEVRWYSPAVFNHVYGKMIVDEIAGMITEEMFRHQADNDTEAAEICMDIRKMIYSRFG